MQNGTKELVRLSAYPGYDMNFVGVFRLKQEKQGVSEVIAARQKQSQLVTGLPKGTSADIVSWATDVMARLYHRAITAYT